MEARFSYGKPKKIDYTPSANVAVGEIVAIGDQLGVAHRPIDAGVLGSLSIAGGVYSVTGDAAIAVGKKVYWNSSSKKATETIGANKYLGDSVTACAGDGSSFEVLMPLKTNAGGSVADPVFASQVELFATTKSVTLTTTTSGASIYYTTDGSTPTSSATLYSGAFTVSSTTTVKAIAIKAGLADSSVVTQIYTKISDLFGGGDNGFFIDASSVANLKANSDGSGAVTSNGDPVGRATDLSGKGLHLTQATSGARPTYQDGALSFNGSSQYLFTVSGPVATAALTMVIVGKSTASSAGQSVIGGRGTYFNFYDVDGSLNFLAKDSTSYVEMNRSIRDRQHVFTLRRTSDSVAEVRCDGVKVGADFNPSEASATDYFVIGAQTVFGVSPGPCIVSKALLINRKLTDAEIAKVEDYMLDEIEGSQAYDILLVAGQSNTYYGTGYNAGIDVTNANVDEFAQNQQILLAAEPLDSFVGRNTGYIGPALQFARDYVADGQLTGGRKLLIVHCGYGGTGFDGTSPTTWADAAGSLREQTIRRAQAAVGLHVENAVVGMIWVQGENDQAAGGSYVTGYEANLLDLFSDFRSQIPTASAMPIVVGSMTGSSVDSVANGTAINAVHANIASTSPPAVYVDNTDMAPADIHFTAANQRVIGSRMFTAWKAL